MPFRATVLLLALVGGVVAQERDHRASPSQLLGACAAFALDGTSAAVSIEADSFLLEIAKQSGSLAHLSLRLRYPVTAIGQSRFCNIYFDRKTGLVAVGIGPRLHFEGQLQVAVADLKTLTWVGDWGVGHESGFYSPSLAGFLEGTTSVAVTGEPPSSDGHGVQHGSFATLLFDPTGEHLMPTTAIRIYARATDLFPTYADARHNRLWFFRCVMVSAPWSRQPLCPVSSVALAGEEQISSDFTPSTQGKKRTELWFLPQSFAAPDSDTIMIAEGITLWRVDLQTQTMDQLVLPIRVHYPHLEEAHAASAISPDGQVVAVPLTLEALAFPYLVDNYVYKGTDIAVVRLRPLQFLGIVRHENASDPVAFAVDHRQGRVTILICRKGHWQRHELGTTLKP